MKTMDVIILGVGQVGLGILRYLATQGSRVVVIDESKERLKAIEDKFDVRTIVGFGSYPKILKKAYVKDCGLFIAVTSSDEVNILSCAITKQISKDPITIARIRRHQYEDMPMSIGVDVLISPEIEVANTICQSIKIGNCGVQLTFKEVKIIGLKCLSSGLLQTPIKFIEFSEIGFKFLFVQRGNTVFVPKEDDVISFGDLVYVIVKSEHVSKLMEAFGYFSKNNKRVLVLGGGNVGLTLVQKLNDDGISSVIIEQNKDRAKKIAPIIPFCEILNGDALDKDLILEAGSFDVAVSVTQDDKVNILASLLTKHLGSSSNFCLLNNKDHIDLVCSLGIDSVINPNIITISSIYSYIKKSRTLLSHPVFNEVFEIIEAEVQDLDPIIGMQNSNIHNSIVLLIRNDEYFFSPTNQNIIANDKLIMCVKKENTSFIFSLFSDIPSKKNN